MKHLILFIFLLIGLFQKPLAQNSWESALERWGAQLNEAEAEIHGADPEDFIRLEIHARKLNRAGELLHSLDPKVLRENLTELNAEDQYEAFQQQESALLKRRNTLLLQLEEANNRIKNTETQRLSLLTEAARKAIVEEKPRQAADLLLAAIELDPTYPPAQLALARMDMNKKLLNPAADRLIIILTQLSPSLESKTEARNLSYHLLEIWSNLIRVELTKGSISKAADLWDNANQFCNRLLLFPGFPGNRLTPIRDGLNESGLALSLIQAENALDLGEFEKARGLITKCGQLMEKVQAGSAFTENSADKLNALNVRLLTRENDKDRNLAERLLAAEKYLEALDLFEKVKDSRDDAGLPIDPGLETLRAKAASPLVEKMSLQADSLLEAGNIQEASRLSTIVGDWFAWYPLNKTEPLYLHYQIQQTLIREKVCQNIDSDISINQEQANAANEISDYRAQEHSLERMLALIDRYPECEFDRVAVINTLTGIKNPATYQRKMAEIDRLISRHKFEEAVEGYKECEEFYKESALSIKADSPEPLYMFLASHPEKYFLQFGVEFYLKKNEPETALQLLKHLADRPFIQYELDLLTEKTAWALAKKDFSQTSTARVRDNIAKYQVKSKALMRFGQYYKQAWRNF